ncbi:unnamed protein product [Amoebophrya sp. A120]|nr:unnamed protein product [Amoebophrya sp. A120]|eukprot:GSA120T00005340001.1
MPVNPSLRGIALMKEEEASVVEYFKTTFVKRKFHNLEEFLDPGYVAHVPAGASSTTTSNAGGGSPPGTISKFNELTGIAPGETLFNLLTKATEKFVVEEQASGHDSTSASEVVTTVTDVVFFPLCDETDVKIVSESDTWRKKVDQFNAVHAKFTGKPEPDPWDALDVKDWLCKSRVRLSNGDVHSKLWLFSPISGRMMASWPATIDES